MVCPVKHDTQYAYDAENGYCYYSVKLHINLTP